MNGITEMISLTTAKLFQKSTFFIIIFTCLKKWPWSTQRSFWTGNLLQVSKNDDEDVASGNNLAL